ncbi:hypothetical protein [Hymenobacter persicinus]|uniref:Uncharacterized protein n=1 Tax=Hymenobacter persicinus TaxID=2025506 RepID=A0A4Q5LG02_9BACT|nr:hypothetical protein [Hymenobacter persicinus]RYU84344.1 hypothetical protein EWM57_01235 [Hymenobacter persicinus]
MLRSWLILLLLCNYLLVVGAGLVNRPEAPRYTAAHPYVHSHACQQQNYLRLDCFGTCNGDQHALDKQQKAPTSQQLLTMSKGIDLHCLTTPILISRPRFGRLPLVAAELVQPLATGFGTRLDFPPRRG